MNRFAALLSSLADLLDEKDIIGLWCGEIYGGFVEFLEGIFAWNEDVNEVLEKLIYLIDYSIIVFIYYRWKIKILENNFVNRLGANMFVGDELWLYELRILIIMKE